jgi:hypothetical protein
MDANNVMLSLHIGLESQGAPQGNGQEKHVLFSAANGWATRGHGIVESIGITVEYSIGDGIFFYILKQPPKLDGETVHVCKVIQNR